MFNIWWIYREAQSLQTLCRLIENSPYEDDPYMIRKRYNFIFDHSTQARYYIQARKVLKRGW